MVGGDSPIPGESGSTPPDLLNDGGEPSRGSGDTRGPRKSRGSGDTRRSGPSRGSGDTR